MAWIIVDIGERDWSKLAYQFGHELGHILANSWRANAKPAPPCQWIEEAAAEAFSLYGLSRLATAWKTDPPFAGDNSFGDAIAQYRTNITTHYQAVAEQQGLSAHSKRWFEQNREAIEEPALNAYAKAFAGKLLAEYERDHTYIESIGCLNRWPGRSAVPTPIYLRKWKESCEELGASSALPLSIQAWLGIP
jgi:hypothetical protein